MKFKNYWNIIIPVILLFTKNYSANNLIPFKDPEAVIRSVSNLRSFNGDEVFKRALLVHTADRSNLSDEERNTGWGKIDISKADAFIDSKYEGAIVTDVVSRNKTHFLNYRRNAEEPVIATLSWDKKYSADLDIRVVTDGKVNFPISFENSAMSTSRDCKELTTERVDIRNKIKDEFIIQVTAKNRPTTDIPFILLVSGAEFTKKVSERESRISKLKTAASEREERIQEYLKNNDDVRDVRFTNGGRQIIYDVIDGVPVYKRTCNYNAAKSNGVSPIQPGGNLNLNLTGENLAYPIIVWDGGNSLKTHREFGNRVSYGESVGSDEHATHVAGTIMAAGVDENARGMAYNALLKSYDFGNDELEMEDEAQNGCILSNHSYMSSQFTSYGREWDIIANNNPYYCIMKAAANEGPSFNTMPINSNSKNVLTIGSGADQPNGYEGPDVSVSSFSSRGPTPDGRIKPDFIANGAGLYSTSNTSNSSYTSMSGTSMACPSATGSAALIQEHYFLTHGNVYMRSSTLKALIINSADEVADDGPDYNSGYGYMNAGSACKIINDNRSGKGSLINELTLLNGDTYEVEVIPIPGEEIQATLCWNDPAAASSSGTNSKLVNDLDIRISNGGTIYYPWKCNPNSPSASATKGDNSADNVEKIEIENVTSSLIVSVSHKGTLSSSQIFSLVMSGVVVNKDPFIDIKSPVDNEVLEQYGQTEIAWVSNIDDKVTVDLYKGQISLVTLAENIENSGSLVWDIPEDFETGDDYRIKVSSDSNDTLYDFSGEFSIINEFIITDFPYHENFDTLDTGTIILPQGYIQSKDDDINWIILSGPTPSKVGISPNVTGPDGDNTTGTGNYIYIEASDPNNPGKSASFATPKFTLNSDDKPALIFSYHMFSDTGAMGELLINIASDGVITEKIIELTDDDYGDEWHTDTVDLTSYSGKRVTLTFNGTTGSLWASDICVDDIKIINANIVSNIEILKQDDKRTAGFMVGPNPCENGKNVHFKFKALYESSRKGTLNIFDMTGNKIIEKEIGRCELGKEIKIGIWDLKNSKGLNVAKGTYLAELIIENIKGEKYRIQKYIGIK